MKEIVQRIRFQGKEYIFLGEDLNENSSITTAEAYQKGTVGYAHFFPGSCRKGNVMRYGKAIGFGDEIEFIGELEIEIDISFFSIAKMFFDPSWNKREES